MTNGAAAIPNIECGNILKFLYDTEGVAFIEGIKADMVKAASFKVRDVGKVTSLTRGYGATGR